MPFDEEHAAFIRYHLESRTGERRGRLERGHRHGELLFLSNVWWPLRGSLKDLHPEYEVLDWRGRSYFADFAWLPGHVKLLFEIKGFTTHPAKHQSLAHYLPIKKLSDSRPSWLSRSDQRMWSFTLRSITKLRFLCSKGYVQKACCFLLFAAKEKG